MDIPMDVESWSGSARERGEDALNGKFGAYICSIKYNKTEMRCDCYIFEDIIFSDEHTVYVDININNSDNFGLSFAEQFITDSSKEVYDISPEYKSKITSMLV